MITLELYTNPSADFGRLNNEAMVVSFNNSGWWYANAVEVCGINIIILMVHKLLLHGNSHNIHSMHNYSCLIKTAF